ncbi:MAG: hypothetical protein IJT75_10820 [Bacteroidaceae bacterium]|nr:hypothetical protein [Bacteroidaceae bacterium]
MSRTLAARFSLSAKPQDGVTYVIRTAAERAYIAPNTATATFTSDYRFFKSKGGKEAAVAMYVVIAVRAKSGSRSVKLRVNNTTVTSVASFGINVTTADAAIEVFIFDTAPTVSNYYNSYVAKKEIPIEKQADRQRRIRWMQGGQEITMLSCTAGGTPKTYRDLTAQLVENVNGTDTVMAAAETDLWEVKGYIRNTGQWTTVNDDIFEDGVASVVLDWDDDQDLQRDMESYNRLRVNMNIGGSTHSSVLPFVYDGAAGPRGYSGPLLVPKGVWKDNASYTATPTRAEYVFDTVEHDFFHVTPPTSGTRTATVGTRPGLNPSHWTRLGAIDPFYTSMAVIDGGTVGSAVFWAQFMYSQYGRNPVLDSNYNITGYEEVDGVTDSDGDGTPNTYDEPVQTGSATAVFEPNLWLNFLTGEAYMKKATVEGRLLARELSHSFVHCQCGASGAASVLLPSQNSGNFTWLTQNYIKWASLWKVGDDYLPSKISLDRTLQPSGGYTRVTMPPAQNFLGQEVELFTSPTSFELHIGGGSSSSGNLFEPGFGQSVIAVLAPRAVWATYGVTTGKRSSVRLLAVADGTGTYGWMILGGENFALNISDTP